MARFDERSGQLYVTELGRVASHFYIRHASIVAFNEMLRPHMSEAEVRRGPSPLSSVGMGASACNDILWPCMSEAEAASPVFCESGPRCMHV